MTDITDISEQKLLRALGAAGVKSIADRVAIKGLLNSVKQAVPDALNDRTFMGEEGASEIEKMIQAAQDYARGIASGQHSVRWLWTLRRMLATDYCSDAYTWALAESLSATGEGGVRAVLAGSPGELRFPIDREIAFQTWKLLLAAIFISDLHSAYRWVCKGAGVRFGRNGAYAVDAPSELIATVKRYDVRKHASHGFLSRTGLSESLSSGGDGDLYSVALVHRVKPEVVSVPGSFVGLPVSEAKLQRAFDIEPASLETLMAWSDGLESRVWLEEAYPLLRLLRIAQLLIARSKAKLLMPMTRGYMVLPRSELVALADEALKGLKDPLPDPPSSGEKLVAQIEELDEEAWPLRPGPIARRVDGLLMLDLWAATTRLDASLEFVPREGSIVNARSRRFEDNVQAVIDSASLRPAPEIAELRGRHLKVGGLRKLEIDAMFQFKGCLVLVSCKSIICGDLYDAGDFVKVRNARTTVEKACVDWMEQIAFLDVNRKGDNYDLAHAGELLGIVCTPTVVFTASKEACEEVLQGLPRAVALPELAKWLVEAGA